MVALVTILFGLAVVRISLSWQGAMALIPSTISRMVKLVWVCQVV
jgi:hypothetical protein